MGTINYGTSDIITLGIRPYDYDDYTDSTGDINYDAMQSDYDTDIDNMVHIISRYDYNAIDVAIAPGYYEGYYINIVNNLDDASPEDAITDVNNLQHMLTDLAGIGLCKIIPGWCTAYYNYNDTIASIQSVITTLIAQYQR